MRSSGYCGCLDWVIDFRQKVENQDCEEDGVRIAFRVYTYQRTAGI